MGLEPHTPLVLYTGTFEAYQGLDLLFAAMAFVRAERPDARLLLAGGKPDQVEKARAEARAAGIDDVTVFAGERPAAEIPAYLLASDVLVSPRSRGTNTPLKIYQYLRSGKPIVATRLLTHTQVLSDDTAILTGASPREFADGILQRSGTWPVGRTRKPGARARRDEVQLRGVSRTDAASLRGPGARHAAGAREGRGVTERRDHYSYTVYADPNTARRFDQTRFGSPIGQLVAAREAETFSRMAGAVAGRSVLDVGTGTGRLALLMTRRRRVGDRH